MNAAAFFIFEILVVYTCWRMVGEVLSLFRGDAMVERVSGHCGVVFWFCGSILLCFVFVMSGCGASYRSTETLAYVDSLSSEPIDGSEGIFLSVNNFHGTVHVSSDSSVRGIKIKRSLHAREKDLEQAGRNIDWQNDLKHSLDFIDYRASLSRVSGGAICTVSVMTSYPEPENQWVELDIRVPHLAGVNIRTSDGEVTVANANGPMTIYNNHGDIVVSTVFAVRDDVLLVTAEGHIDFRLPVESTGSVFVSAVGGRAVIDVPNQLGGGDIGDRFGVRYSDRSHARGTLNAGGNGITLRTAGGNGRVIVSEDPGDISIIKKLSLPVRP